jgi:tryptophan synthase beta chain
VQQKSKDTSYFGPFGGRYVAGDLLYTALEELERAYERYRGTSREFVEELNALAKDFVGRPTPLMFAREADPRVGRGERVVQAGGPAHTGAHKINNALGQMLLAERMGKTRIIAETGAGQHGVATATVAALYGRECVVYMGEEGHAAPGPERAAHEASRAPRSYP